MASAPRFASALVPTSTTPTYEEWLVDRITFGRNPDIDLTISRIGPERFLTQQLNWSSINDPVAESLIAQSVPTFTMTPFEILKEFPPFEIKATKYQAGTWIVNAWKSKRQLLHVMADFWTNVFSRYAAMDLQQFAYAQYDRHVFYGEEPSAPGANALGNFQDMLEQATKGTSMNFYLNQWLSKPWDPIENLAREILELHTLGVDPKLSLLPGQPPAPDPSKPDFTEADVVEFAKALTGWAFEGAAKFDENGMLIDNPDMGKFEFHGAIENHTMGPKTVYGNTYHYPGPPEEDGVKEGEDILRDLSVHPRTAEHMARRLIKWFVTPEPPDWLVTKVENAFQTTANSGVDNIREAAEALFERDTFMGLSAADRRYRRPLNMTMSLLRAVDPMLLANPNEEPVPINSNPNEPPYEHSNDQTRFDGLLDQLEKLGQHPGFWPAPDGYPYEDEVWIPGLLPRLEFCDKLMHNGIQWVDLTDARLDTLFAGTNTNLQIAQRAADIITGGSLDGTAVGHIEDALDEIDALPDPNGEFDLYHIRRDALALAASSHCQQYLS